jgi:hypothetical protein
MMTLVTQEIWWFSEWLPSCEWSSMSAPLASTKRATGFFALGGPAITVAPSIPFTVSASWVSSCSSPSDGPIPKNAECFSA